MNSQNKLAFCYDEVNIYVAFESDHHSYLAIVPFKKEDDVASILPLAVQQCLAGQRPDVVIVPRGPGSFTSVRIVLAFAYGLGPTKTVSTFEMLAFGAKLQTGFVAIDTKCNSFYTQWFQDGLPKDRAIKSLDELSTLSICVSSSPKIPFAHYPKINWAKVLLEMPFDDQIEADYLYTPKYKKQ